MGKIASRIKRFIRIPMKDHIYSFSKKHKSIRKAYDTVEALINPYVANYEEQDGWSFVITSGGNNNMVLKNAVLSILSEFEGTENYEIIIVGPKSCKQFEKYGHVFHHHYKEFNILPGWVTRKKNIGVSISKYDKCVVMHDYIGLNAGFREAMENYCEKYDVGVCRITLDNGLRTRDWLVWDYPDIGPGMLPYDIECTKYQYISGAFFIVRKRFYMENRMDEKLRWNEADDIEWSKRIREKTKFVINKECSVKFLKPKPVGGAPYCKEWIENTRKLYEKFGVESEW